jgi:hypothetical protein
VSSSKCGRKGQSARSEELVWAEDTDVREEKQQPGRARFG